MKLFDHKKTKGFTLIEMMVAVFVFSMVMTIAVGAIFSIVTANKTSQALKSVMDNLSSALDSMSRDIRYGTIYNCGNPATNFVTPNSCPNGGYDSFSFINKDQENIIYAFLTAGLNTVPSGSTGFIFKCTDAILTANCIPLTAPEVHIKNMEFYVQGAGWNDIGHPENIGQPELLITLDGFAQVGSNKSSFNIETMISQRNLECKNSVQSTQGLSCP